MFITLRSPFGGEPVNRIGLSRKGRPNFMVADKTESPIVTEDSIYCHKIGYYYDGEQRGEPATMKDADAYKLYLYLHKIFGQIPKSSHPLT